MAKSNSFIFLVAAATALMQCWQALLSYTTELSAVWLPNLAQWTKTELGTSLQV